MSKTRWYLILGISLVIASSTVYLMEILIFHNVHDTFFYLFQDLAFVPVQVLLVMLILDKLLQKKEKESLMNKMNMMIGVFFNEVGTDLISFFIETEKNITSLRKEIIIDSAWNTKTFESGKKFFKSYNSDLEINQDLLMRMKEYLLKHRDCMINLPTFSGPSSISLMSSIIAHRSIDCQKPTSTILRAI
jgi:sensor histidine kinase YesM